MKVYNSLTKNYAKLPQKELQIYACGPTVYNYIHIGNARPSILMDVLTRYFNFRKIPFNFFQNITDIDDKIIQKALEEKKTEFEVAEFFTQAYFKDLEALNVNLPTVVESISKFLPEMVEFIQTLVDKGFAYVVDGDVYFAVDKWTTEYGKLSSRKIAELISGERVEIDAKKKNPLDFSLWKKTTLGKKWDSPFGKGRPGWHTECALLIHKYFQGQTIDLHVGGVDLKFPHHENERIQFLAQNNKEIANIWMHNGHLNLDNQKMSKSLGNVVLVRDFVKTYNPNLLRWIFLTTNYKQPLDLTPNLIEQGEKFFAKLANLRKKLISAKLFNPNHAVFANPDLLTSFQKAMDDDLNTAQVLSIIDFGIKALNKAINQKITFSQFQKTYDQLVKILEVLGFFPLLDLNLSLEEQKLYLQWKKSLEEKDYQKADQLRKILQAKDLL